MDVIQSNGSLTYLQVQIIGLRQLMITQNPCQSHVMVSRQIFIHRYRILDKSLAMLDIFAFLAAEILVETGLRLGGDHYLIPFFLRMLAAGSQHLDLIATLERVGEGNEGMVHFGADAMLAQLRVKQESEIQRGSALRHRLDLTLRREDEYLLRKQIEFEVTEELHRIFLRVRQYILDLLNPLVQLAVVRLAGLVFPVRGITMLGYLVHAVGTDLHLYPLAVLTHDSHVQRLIAVRFGRGDPVADTFGVRAIELGDGGIDHPALVFLTHRLVGGEDDTQRHQVIDIFESTLLLHHLLPNRIDGFDARFEGEAITHRLQAFTDRTGELLEVLELAGFDRFELVVYILPCVRVLVFETQILEFGLDRE